LVGEVKGKRVSRRGGKKLYEKLRSPTQKPGWGGKKKGVSEEKESPYLGVGYGAKSATFHGRKRDVKSPSEESYSESLSEGKNTGNKAIWKALFLKGEGTCDPLRKKGRPAGSTSRNHAAERSERGKRP